MTRFATFLILLIVSSASIAAGQTTLPKLELGVSLAALHIPNYPGASQHSSFLLPLPYIKYRGEILRVDDGIQGVLFDSEKLFVSLSANATLAVDKDNPERIGMASLAPSVEIGPSLDYRLVAAGKGAWWIELPLRFTFTLDSSFDNIGQVIHPRLAWRKPYRSKGEWKLRFASGPVFASQRYHNYYYAVGPGDAIAGRPGFTSASGYGGLRTDFSYSRRFGDYWIGGFMRLDHLRGGVFEHSPLVSDTSSWTTGIALAWIFDEQYN